MQFASIMEHLAKNSYTVHLDTAVQETGTGQKKSVTYGYGKSRRRYMTEAAGDEYNPQQPTKSAAGAPLKRGLLERLAGREEEVEVSGRDSLARFEPTLYWLMKDLAKGKDNPHLSYWCGINDGSEGAPQRDYTLQTPLDWLSHDKALKQVEGHRRAGKVGSQRTLIICVLGGVTYAEIRSAAELERRTGCKVLIGGTEVLSPQTFLQRMSMHGDWTTVTEEPEPPKYNPKENIAVAAAVAADQGRAGGGASDTCLDKVINALPRCCAKWIEGDVPVSRPMSGRQTQGAAAPPPAPAAVDPAAVELLPPQRP